MPYFRLNSLLNLGQQLRAKLDVARLVDAVHVAEGEGGHVAALLAEAERLDRGRDVADRRVEGVVRALVLHAVFFAADDADLDLENGVDRLHAGEEVAGDLEVLGKRHSRAVPHVRLEDRVAPGLDLGLARGDERHDEAVERVFRAVVGVQRDRDGVVLGDLGGEGGEGEGTGCSRLDRLPREVVGAAGGHLDDAVRAGLAQALQHGVDRRRRRHVDGGVGEPALLALSSISAYCSGVAMGMRLLVVLGVVDALRV